MKLFKLFAVKLKGDARNALCARCANGTPESVAELLKEKFPDISTIRQALLALDDSKKEVGSYDPNQFDTEDAEKSAEDESPLVQGMLKFNELSKSVVELEDWVSEKAADISKENRILIAGQLKELADKLVKL